MRKALYSLPALLVMGALAGITYVGCSNTPGPKANRDSLALKKNLTSPVLSPEESIKKMHIESGFAVKLVAAEPLTNAPVALSFDDKGRIWVVEMVDYMPDTSGTGEDQPLGKVVIL